MILVYSGQSNMCLDRKFVLRSMIQHARGYSLLRVDRITLHR